MFGGYNIIEGLWKRKEKEKYLENHLNPSEKIKYTAMDYMCYIALFLFILDILYGWRHPINLGWLLVLGFTSVLSSIIKQVYRKIKLIKYEYNQKSEIRDIIVNILFFSGIIYGLYKFIIYFMNAFQ